MLGKFILYFVCAGQQKAEQLGYSPLPKNLVQIAFDAETQIPGAPAPPPIDSVLEPHDHRQLRDRRGATSAGECQARRGGRGGAQQSASDAAAAAAATDTAATGADATGTNGVRTAGAQLITATGPVAVPNGDGSGFPLYALAIVLLLALAFGPPALALGLQRRRTASAGLNGSAGGPAGGSPPSVGPDSMHHAARPSRHALPGLVVPGARRLRAARPARSRA